MMGYFVSRKGRKGRKDIAPSAKPSDNSALDWLGKACGAHSLFAIFAIFARASFLLTIRAAHNV